MVVGRNTASKITRTGFGKSSRRVSHLRQQLRTPASPALAPRQFRLRVSHKRMMMYGQQQQNNSATSV